MGVRTLDTGHDRCPVSAPGMMNADHVEHLLEQRPPDQAMVALSLSDDVFLRSFNWARWQLGIPLPPD